MSEQKLWELINKLPKKNITNLLFNALDSMQRYNGQSRSDCLVEALEMEINHSLKIPTMTQLREITSSVILDS